MPFAHVPAATPVMPAKAGIHDFCRTRAGKSWMPAFAGMTGARASAQRHAKRHHHRRRQGNRPGDRAPARHRWAAVALIGRDAAALERAAEELGARYAVADVTDHAALRDAIAALGPCDILVNNAGAAISKPFAKHDVGDFETMLAVNLLSAVTRAGRAAGHARQRLRAGSSISPAPPA